MYNLFHSRATLWAKWAFPEEDFASVEKLHHLFTSNLLICSEHFPKDSFLERDCRHLHKYSVPVGALTSDNSISVTAPPTSASSYPAVNFSTSVSFPSTYDEICSDATLVHTAAAKSSNSSPAPNPSSTLPLPNSPSTQPMPSSFPENSTPKNNSSTVKKKPRQSLLSIINSTRVDQLTPKKKKLYYKCRKYASEVCKVSYRYRRLQSRQKLEKLASDETLEKVLKKMTAAATLLFKSQLKNCSDRKPKGRRWTKEEKILGLTIYKKSPSCYRLLRKIFVLPSPTCVKSLLSSVHLNSGINKNVLSTLARAVSKMKPGCDHCVLLFDEVALRRQLLYNQHKDQIDGYQDHGIHGRSCGLANQALVFMLVGLKRKWKQPVAFYLSSGSTSGIRLHVIVKEVLKACFEIGLKVLGTICDMGANNVKAVNLLKEQEYNAYFTFEDRQVAVVYDPCHLLKCYRNNLRKYDVTYDMKSSIVGFNKKGMFKKLFFYLLLTLA